VQSPYIFNINSTYYQTHSLRLHLLLHLLKYLHPIPTLPSFILHPHYYFNYFNYFNFIIHKFVQYFLLYQFLILLLIVLNFYLNLNLIINQFKTNFLNFNYPPKNLSFKFIQYYVNIPHFIVPKFVNQ